ncbi:hypothetical protein F2Q69_00030847 [Brassica cretica]|uniref:Uncharacterized protein n=1 Tax=Brassica cretica TaxID=69181 RepID=A0A8S9S0V2_BRACR|nr:hypothetical protein F2Q69_00030847 [Brassica cretica]
MNRTSRNSVSSYRRNFVGSDRTQDLDQDVEKTQHGDQDDQISPTEVQPFSRTRSTDRAVYRIDPRAPGRDLRMDPRADDRISRTTGVLPRPIRHSRATVKPEPMIIEKNQIPDLACLSWPV